MRASNLRAWRDRAAGQLGAADPGREAEVVLDPPRRARLAAERGALDDQRVESLGGAVDRRGESGGAAADHEQVDLLARRELAADPERARDLAGRWATQLGAAREPHERQARRVEPGDQRGRCRVVVPLGSRQVKGSRLLRAKSTIRIVASDERGPTISRPMPSTCCSASRRAMKVESSEVAERAVLEQERAQRVAVDRDVAQRLRDDRGQEDGLPGEQVHLAEEARGAVADDLVAGRVEDRHLALEDRDERIAPCRRRGTARRRRRRVRSSPSAASVASCEPDSIGLAGAATA